MKLLAVALVCTFAVASIADVEVTKRNKNEGRHYKDEATEEENEELEIIAMMERDENALNKYEVNNEESLRENYPNKHPCTGKHCGPGKTCELNKENEPICVCVETCPPVQNLRWRVCSNFNQTWESDCTLHQMRCWCQHQDSKCQKEEFSHMHIDYYGECRDLKDCGEDEMADFPRRMRDWLFNIMQDFANREELSPYYMMMEMEAENSLSKRWSNAAIWKWCELEKNHDRAVSRHELFPIRAQLLALEHCIAPFLDGCDSNNDHKISLQEWAKCLEIEEDVIEEKCEEVRTP